MGNLDLKTRAYHSIRHKLIHCEYVAGTMLNEAQISEELGVSRTPIREALNRIAHEGYIRILPKKGILVTDVTLNDVLQIFQARLEIEPVGLRMAGPTLPKEELLVFRNKFLSDKYDIDKNFMLDTAMHLFIIDNCGNRYLIDMMHKLFDDNTRVVISTRQSEAKVLDARKEHVAILNFLLAEDYANAQSAMIAHIKNCRLAALNFFYNSSI
ncbi:MAG: GntR family transcriptional regulator [Planctomycetota bacterium]|jgi:DNA-binding GntR family transcriptional regulator|nr:GntR family transcriptional regulator [Planctomycetota bacterium]